MNDLTPLGVIRTLHGVKSRTAVHGNGSVLAHYVCDDLEVFWYCSAYIGNRGELLKCNRAPRPRAMFYTRLQTTS